MTQPQLRPDAELKGAADTDIAREAGEALPPVVDVPDTVQATIHDHPVTLSGAVAWEFRAAWPAGAARSALCRSAKSGAVPRSRRLRNAHGHPRQCRG